jgi:hypothetical protein
MIHLLWLSLSIPIIIHLVHRRKAKQVPFSTLRFLQMVDQRVARRHRLKELLLLALRVLLIAALIGALYRPMVRSATFKGANVPTAAAIVLDNTCSMRAAAQGALCFDRARRAAAHVLEGLKRGDAACIVPFDAPGGAASEAITGLDRLRDELNAMECGYGTAEVAGALRQALAALQRSRTPRKELYVISDFQKLSWTAALEELKNALPADMPVFLVDVGRPVGSNLTVAEADFPLSVQVAGAASDLICSVRNNGNADADKELALYVNGDKVAQTRVALAAGAETTVTFAHVFAQTGQTAGEVRLAPDELEPDNARFFTATVQQMLPVLIVNGDPSAVPHLNETFFLELALQSPAAGGPAVSPVQAKTVIEADLLKQRLEDYACVILANVSSLAPLAADRLRRYVPAGGGLIIFTGDRVDPAAYNTALSGPEPGGQGLMPALLTEVKQADSGGQDPGFRIRSLAGGHPAFRGIAEQMETGGARVQRFFSVAPAKGAGESPALVELDAGPLVLERKAGSGTVLLCTTAADLDWSNLPARRFFLPMLHQMVYYAGRSAQGTDRVSVGTPYVLELPPSDEPVEVAFYGPARPEEQGKEAPDAVLRSAPAERANRVTFQGTTRPGIYRAVYSVGGAEHVRLFAVNVEGRESAPARIPPEEAARMLGGASVKVVQGPERLALIVRREREGLPLWDYLFALAVALAVAETFVANVLLREGEAGSS